MFRKLALALCAACLATAGHTAPAKAAPIVYDEAVSGDLDASLPPFVLGLGDNVFAGTTSLFVSFSPFVFIIDRDEFLFSIQPNHLLSSVVLTVTSVFNNSDSAVSVGIGAGTSIRTGVTNDGIASVPSVLVFDSGGPAVGLPLSIAIPEAELGLGADLYRADASFGGSSSGTGDSDFGFNYTLTLGVTPIPLPAGIWLLISGLGALAAMRARPRGPKALQAGSRPRSA